MHNEKAGLTSEQLTNVRHFLILFADVEAALKNRLDLKADNRTRLQTLINDYAKANPFWTNSANQLRQLAEIRNLLVHQCGIEFGYPVAVTERSIGVLLEIKQHLLHPEKVQAKFCRKVKTVSASASLASVVALAFENGYSQFPVVDDGRFFGLITETEIIRWLGRRAKANKAEVDLREVCVKTVLKEKDPTTKGIAIFQFECLDAPVEEVMGLFSRPMLEVVLLNKSGDKHTPIEGIITQWDAARYPTFSRRTDKRFS